MISSRDGLVTSPDGPARQVPQKRPVWSGALFITKDGSPRRRYYDIVHKRWHWDRQPAQMVMNDTGRLGLQLDHWLPLETCVALAWLRRQPDSPTRVILEPGDAIHVDNIRWQQAEDVDDGGAIAGERWKPLKSKCGCVPIADGYQISTAGRLKNQRDEITTGFWYNGTRWAATNSGLVDLLQAARLKPNAVYLREALHEAMECLLSGHSVEDLADSRGIQLSSAWSLINTAAMNLPASELGALGPQHISEDLWDLLVDLRDRQHPVLGRSLTDLKDYVDGKLLGSDGEYADSDYQWEEVRFARLCITANS